MCGSSRFDKTWSGLYNHGYNHGTTTVWIYNAVKANYIHDLDGEEYVEHTHYFNASIKGVFTCNSALLSERHRSKKTVCVRDNGQHTVQLSKNMSVEQGI